MNRFLKAAAAVLVCFFVFGAVSPAMAAKQEWKFAIEEITGSVQDEFAQFFK